MKVATVVVALLIALTLALAAQAPPAAPVLSELDALKVTNASLVIQNLALQIQQAQQLREKYQLELEALLKTLEKPGYQLGPGPDGKLVYTPVPPAKPPQ